MKPKVLVMDIETAPILAYVWGIWDQNVGLNQIESDTYVLSWSAKWLDDPPNKIMYMDQRDAKNMEDDSRIMKGIWGLLDEADIIITQNGKKFDERRMNTRFIMHGMKPPSSYKHIDTLSIAKKKFGFTSNKLEYMTDKLCVKYKKLKHAKYAGFTLWRECLKGNMDAWKEMEKYNKHDVLSLEELYHKLSPWDNTVNFNVYNPGKPTVCKCGHTHFKKNGYDYTKTGKFQRYVCKSCGHETKDHTNLLTPAEKKNVRTR